ncbi:MAG: addiction module protein [Limisphaerales bacterium]
MPRPLVEITREASELPREQRLALAEFLLELEESPADPEVEAVWEEEIQNRIRAIDDGSAKGIPYEQVMREAQDRLAK